MKRPCDQEGYPGHWVIWFSSTQAPKVTNSTGSEYLREPGAVRPAITSRCSVTSRTTSRAKRRACTGIRTMSRWPATARKFRSARRWPPRFRPGRRAPGRAPRSRRRPAWPRRLLLALRRSLVLLPPPWPRRRLLRPRLRLRQLLRRPRAGPGARRTVHYRGLPLGELDGRANRRRRRGHLVDARRSGPPPAPPAPPAPGAAPLAGSVPAPPGAAPTAPVPVTPNPAFTQMAATPPGAAGRRLRLLRLHRRPPAHAHGQGVAEGRTRDQLLAMPGWTEALLVAHGYGYLV
jgi:hypothetical protein